MLDVAKSLQATLHEVQSNGNSLLELGGGATGIALDGVANFNTGLIHWI